MAPLLDTPDTPGQSNRQLQIIVASMGLLAGIVLAMVVSIVAGLYPARRAAKLEPLETLRLG